MKYYLELHVSFTGTEKEARVLLSHLENEAGKKNADLEDSQLMCDDDETVDLTDIELAESAEDGKDSDIFDNFYGR